MRRLGNSVVEKGWRVRKRELEQVYETSTALH